MSNSAIGTETLPQKCGIPLLLALIAAGLAGNYLKYPIFLDIDFLFGSIFAMLALQFCGRLPGIAAAALIAAATYFLWGHPYAILILMAEVAVVGELMRRFRIGLVLSDALYWLAVGMPLVYLFYHGMMEVPPGNTTIVMVKQAVNGIANALLARLIFIGLTFKSHSLITYRDLTYNLLVFFALWPTLLLLAVASKSDYTDTDRSIRRELHQTSLHITQRLEVWIKDRTPSIVDLAGMAATHTPQQMQVHMEQALAADVNFQRIGLLDKSATSTAYVPTIDELGRSNIGRHFADRPYIPVLKQTLKPMLSEVMMSRTGIPVPIVTLLAPVVINDEYGGYITGVLSMDQIRDYLETSAEDDTLLYTLLDKSGKIILSNRSDQKTMDHFRRGEGDLKRIDGALAQWVPTLPANTPVMERWKSSYYVAETAVGHLAEWKLVLEQPVAPFQKTLYARYTHALTLLFLMLLAVLALAEFLSRRITASTEQLSKLTQDLPATLKSGVQPVWPESTIFEANKLIANFREMAKSLSAQFSANQELNTTLAQQVDARTAELRESEKQFRLLVMAMAEGVTLQDANSAIITFNPSAERILGLTADQLLGKTSYDPGWRAIHEDGSPFPGDTHPVPETLRTGLPQSDVIMGIHKPDGTLTWISVNVQPIFKDGETLPYRVVATMHDITERKQSEFALKRANRALRTLSACNEALVRAANESELLEAICRHVVETGGYRMAWVGYPQQDAAKTVRPVAQYGNDEGYLANAKISWADTERGRGPTGTAIRTGTIQVNQDFLTSPALALWREAARQRDYQSSIALPLKNAAGTFGALTIYSSEPESFNEGEVDLLRELAEDLAFGIETLRTRADRDRISYEHQHHEEILRQSLEDSIKAIADTVEMRDPYTAGHQRRVGELAVAISRELGLPEERVHGLELAASIHDLGKISIPAEILAKPSKLSEVEFMLIKSHAQAGYNILKDIKFPWPIATMVWQHHERLDGTGYPQGLKGDQILLESRIMAVADVIEAMASHRPYRPGLGIDKALAEIERGRGTVYDVNAADACVRLFREKGYTLPA